MFATIHQSSMSQTHYGSTLTQEDEETSSLMSSLPAKDASLDRRRVVLAQLLNLLVFLFSFVFYGYCVFSALSPVPLYLSEEPGRRLAEEATVACTVGEVAVGTGLGAVAGAVLVGGALLLIGLSPAGPIAGGLFAANMGAGLVSGSLMAGLQSAAMTGVAYSTGAAVGAAAGAGVAATTSPSC